MNDFFLIRGKKLLVNEIWAKNVQSVIKNNNIILVSITFIIFGLMLRIWDAQPVFYAHAYTENKNIASKIQPPLLSNDQIQLFAKSDGKNHLVNTYLSKKNKTEKGNFPVQADFAEKIYTVVGNTPMKEMVPYISERDEKVAAFLVGIAKKESSLGNASPSKGGETCYNYWGYKGAGGKGSVGSYACFASAEEAVEIVGNRIEVLISKDRNTPARMVHTWKCGTDCSQDPGVLSWISTVALYFNKIVS